MKNISANRIILTVIIAAVPPAASADSGEGIAFGILFGSLLYVNILWPIVVPMFFLKRAKKKVSLYAYSLCICGLLAWLLIYVLPQHLLRLRYPVLTNESIRVGALFVVLASVMTFLACLKIIPMLRTFNDTHD